ncbi:hypothetical protein CLF_104178, partial [Clonorchis sinensis]
MHGEKGPEDITRIDAKKDLGIWLSPNLSSSLHLEKSAQKAFAVLRMIKCTFSRVTRTDFRILYGAYVRPFLEFASPVVYSGRTKDVILIERVQRPATKKVAGLKSVDYKTRLAVLDFFPLEYRRLREDLILTYALFEQGLANRMRKDRKTAPGKMAKTIWASGFLRACPSLNVFAVQDEKGPEDSTRKDGKNDLGIWLSSSMSFSLQHEQSVRKAFAVL